LNHLDPAEMKQSWTGRPTASCPGRIASSVMKTMQAITMIHPTKAILAA
jgi:hypothetical protein